MKQKLLLFISIAMSIIWAIYMGYLPKPQIPIPNFLIKEVTVIKEIPIEKKVEVEVEVVKYLEKEGYPTSEFVMSLNPRIDPNIAKQIGQSIDDHSKTYQLPRKLILSIIKKESSFNPFAKSNVAIGLMQIYPKFHKEKIRALGINDNRKLYHIDYNIELGCQIFREYLDRAKGDLTETFHKYLSKSATTEQRDKYKNAILTTWAELEFIEYQHKNGKDKS